MAARYRKKLTTAFQARGRSRKKPTKRRARNMTTLHSRVVRARARALIRTTRVRRAAAIRSTQAPPAAVPPASRTAVMVWSASSKIQETLSLYWTRARNSSKAAPMRTASHTSLNTRSTGESTIPSCPGRWPAAHRRNSSRRAAAPRNTRASPPYRGPLAAYPSHRVSRLRNSSWTTISSGLSTP